MNDKIQTTSEIQSIISKVLKIPEEKIFINSSLFADLGIDSLSGVEIFAQLDEKYQINIPENRLKQVQTVGDLIELVRSLCSKDIQRSR
jgi:acyl carrier protein